MAITPEQARKELERRGAITKEQAQQELDRRAREAERGSFADDVKATFAERTQNALESIRRFGAQGPIETGLQLGGQASLGLFDVMIDALTRGGGALVGEERSAGLGEAGANLLGEAGDKASSVLTNFDRATLGFGGAVANRVAPLVERAGEFIEDSPRTQANIDAAIGIGSLFAPPARGLPKGPLASPSPTVLGSIAKPSATARRGADALIDSAARTEAASRSARIEELVTPYSTKKVRTQEAKRTTLSTEGKKREGVISDLFEKRKVELDKMQQRAADVLKTIPGVGERVTQSVQNNFNKVQAWVRKEADDLINSLSALGDDGIYQWGDLKVIADNLAKDFKALPTLAGEAAKPGRRIVDKFFDLAANEEKTLAGLLRVRRELDAWVLKNKPNAFNEDAATTAMTTAVRAVRREVNDFINAKAGPRVGVRESLERQSAALHAMDDMAVKAGAEPASKIRDIAHRLQKIPALRNSVTALLSVAAGIGPVAAAAMFAPAAAATLGVVGLGAGTAAVMRSTFLRRNVGEAIKIIDSALQRGLDPQTVQALKLDRAVLADWLEQTVEE